MAFCEKIPFTGFENLGVLLMAGWLGACRDGADRLSRFPKI